MTQLWHDFVNDSIKFYFQLQRQFNIHNMFLNWTTTKTTTMGNMTMDNTTAITIKNFAKELVDDDLLPSEEARYGSFQYWFLLKNQ